MNIVADESVDQAIVERLRRDGHTVTVISELAPSISDDQVLQTSRDLGAMLITADKDFGELVFRRKLVHTGVVLLRFSGLPNAAKADRTSEVIRDRASELAGAFSVITPQAVRIHR